MNVNPELIKRAEDLILAMKEYPLQSDEIADAYANLITLLIEIKIRQEAATIQDLEFQYFLSKIGIRKG